MLPSAAKQGVRSLSLVLAFAALLFTPWAARAQHVAGVLLEADESTPAGGLVLRVREIGSGRLISSVRSGPNGEFRIFVGRDSVQVEALRIGSLPSVLTSMRTAVDLAGARFVVRSQPIELPPVGTVDRTRCRNVSQGAEAGLAATLFDQARTLFTMAVAHDSSATYRWRLRRVALTEDGVSVLADNATDASGSLIPMPPTRVSSELFRDGFHGATRKRVEEYYAPTAEFFAHDRFARDYCLFLFDREDARFGEIGVGFRPARARGVSQVAGVIWFRRDSLLLRRIEYSYLGLPQTEASGNPKGFIDFEQLVDGRFSVLRWCARMPQVTETQIGRRRNPHDDAFVITNVRTLNGVLVFEADIAPDPAEGRIDSTSRQAAQDALRLSALGC